MPRAADHIEIVVQVGADDWLACEDPVRVVAAQTPGEVRPALAEVERLTRDYQLEAFGYVSYEAGAAFGLAAHPSPSRLPLVWFGFFEPDQVRRVGRPASQGSYRLEEIHPTVDRPVFRGAFARVKEHIAAGDTYQVNYTFRMTGGFSGDPKSLFADLVDAQRGRHCAYLAFDGFAICSASPELFFALKGLEVIARPMKGTARRGLTAREDRARRDALQSSSKERAENVMIVDMTRNDLGRIAQVGSVAATELFAAERYPTVWQLTSTVTARSTAALADVFAALHPAASVTGAPKVRTMEIVRELEAGPRGVYTGAIGHVGPDGNASFSVGIRTAVVDREQGVVDFGVGSGIVWDSDAEAEYDECLLKGSVLGRALPHFDLLETMRWTPAAGFFLLERHLARLRESADYFGIQVDEPTLTGALAGVSASTAPLRVRLLVSADGRAHVEQTALVRQPGPLTVRLAPEPVDRDNVFLFHKTTQRGVYERAREQRGEADDVVLWNRQGQVTEATTANLVVEIDGERVTPPVDCGLLAGTYRAQLLDEGQIREGAVTIEQFRSAPRFWLINSVHESREGVRLE